MSARANPVVIGAFVVGALALVVIGLVVFGGINLLHRPLKVVMYFDESVNGLAVGAPLSYRGALLPGVRIALFPWTGPRSIQYQILVDVIRFDGALGGSAVLEARWRILDADRKELREGRFVVSEPAGGPGYPALVGAMSRSLGALSREVAAALKAV